MDGLNKTNRNSLSSLLDLIFYSFKISTPKFYRLQSVQKSL
jgi:hypothetical protein